MSGVCAFADFRSWRSFQKRLASVAFRCVPSASQSEFLKQSIFKCSQVFENVGAVERIELPTNGLQNLDGRADPVSSCADLSRASFIFSLL